RVACFIVSSATLGRAAVDGPGLPPARRRAGPAEAPERRAITPRREHALEPAGSGDHPLLPERHAAPPRWNIRPPALDRRRLTGSGRLSSHRDPAPPAELRSPPTDAPRARGSPHRARGRGSPPRRAPRSPPRRAPFDRSRARTARGT